MAADSTEIVEKVYKAYNIQEKDPVLALQLGYEIIAESEEIGFDRGIAYGCLRVGDVLSIKGSFDSAGVFARRAYRIRYQMSDIVGASNASSVLGRIYMQLGIRDTATIWYLRAIQLAEEANDTIQLIYANIDLADMQYENQIRDSAYRRYNSALDIAKTNGDLNLISVCQGAVGRYHLNEENNDTALVYIRASLNGFKALGNLEEVAIAENNIALCYVNLNQFEKALPYFGQALTKYVSLGLEDDVALAYYNLGFVHYKQGHHDSVVFYVKKALKIAETIQDLERQLWSHKLLSGSYASMEIFDKAYHHRKQYSILSDSLLDAQKLQSMADMQTKYETEKQVQAIALLNEKNKTQKAQKRFLIAGVALAILALFVLAFYYIQRGKTARKNATIASQKIQALIDEQEIKTYNAMLEGQEEERMRISADLHDRLGSMLSTIKLMFSALGDKIDRAQEDNRTQLDKANHLIDHACDEVRRISHNLGSGMVASFGLVKSLEELCDSIYQTGKINCTFSSHNMIEDLPLTTEIEIYRIVQEALNNAIKHAKAKKIEVQISKIEQEVNVHIADDGIGFKVAEKLQSDSMGLLSIQKRAEKIGGQLHIDSFEGRGTTLIIEIPITDS
jgi:signal transduction histidine kinase